MPDTTFNELPMIVVTSDQLDPRIQRQLSAQLQSTIMSVAEVNAEIDNMEAMEKIKQQKADVDNSEFDEEETENIKTPPPVEQEPKEQPQEEKTDEQPKEEPKQDSQDSNKGEDPFEDSGASSQDGTIEQNNSQQESDTGEEISFEAFSSILGFDYTPIKTESVESALPPIKRLLHIAASDGGVDNRTSAVIATIEDPENTVVILDTTEVTDIEAKMEYKALVKQLQERGVMAVDTIEQAVEYLNAAYDELAK